MITLLRICVLIACLASGICGSHAQPKIELPADANGTVDARVMAQTLEKYLSLFAEDGQYYPAFVGKHREHSGQKAEKKKKPATEAAPTGPFVPLGDPIPVHDVQLPDPKPFFEYHRRALQRSVEWLQKRERVSAEKAEQVLNGAVSADWAMGDMMMRFMSFAPFVPEEMALQERDALEAALSTRHFKALGGPLPVAVRFLVKHRGRLRPPENPLEFEEPFFVEVEFDGEDDAQAYDVAIKVGRERNIQVKVYPLADDPARFRSKAVTLEREE